MSNSAPASQGGNLNTDDYIARLLSSNSLAFSSASGNVANNLGSGSMTQNNGSADLRQPKLASSSQTQTNASTSHPPVPASNRPSGSNIEAPPATLHEHNAVVHKEDQPEHMHETPPSVPTPNEETSNVPSGSSPAQHIVHTPLGTDASSGAIHSTPILRATEVSAPQPEFTVGGIVAKAAQTHLDKRKVALRDLLAKAGISGDKWRAQVGFMHGREEFNDLARESTYGADAQIILITVFDTWNWRKLFLGRLGRKLQNIIQFHGLLVWGDKIRPLTPLFPHDHVATPAGVLFQDHCGVSTRDLLQRTGNSLTELHIEASSTSGRLQLRTDHKFQKEGKADGSCLLTFTTLEFTGPENYALKKAQVWVFSDVVCHFKDVHPRGRAARDSDGTFKEVITNTRKESTTKALEVEGSKSGLKGKFNISETKGRDVAAGVETTGNLMEVIFRHDSALNGFGIEYLPNVRASGWEGQRLVLNGGDLPRFSVVPAGHPKPKLESFRVRTLSEWVLEEGTTVKAASSQAHKHLDLAFCTEVMVSNNAQGEYYAECSISNDGF